MQSRRDQVQAYFFVVGRLAAAVVHGRPDVLQPPNRRLTTGTVLGVLVAGLLMAIFGIYGVFVPGGDRSWQQPGAIVMDKTTGARYVFLGNQLRPVLNYSSARLAGGKSNTGEIFAVSQKSLAGTPVGQPIGIAGAPDAIPVAGRLETGAWTVCVQSGATGGPVPGGPVVSLLLGGPIGPPLAAAQAFLVYTLDQQIFLLWQNRRYRIADSAALQALGYGAVQPIPVSPAWLNIVPQAQDLAVPRMPDAGRRGPVIDGRPSRVGQIIDVRNPAIGSDQLYLVRSDGLAPVTRTSAALLLAAPDASKAYPNSAIEPIAAGTAALTGVPISSLGDPIGPAVPPQPPEIVSSTPDSVPCMRFAPGQTGETQGQSALLPASMVDANAVPVARHRAGETADRVAIPVGAGVLARQQSAAGSVPGPYFLVTETGMKFPLADAEVVGALGYSESSAIRMPPALLDLVPTGPLLSLDAALRDAGVPGS